MRQRREKNGFILITLYLLIAVLVILGGNLVTHTMAETQAVHRSQASLQAVYLAEAGLDQAIVQLRQNATWAGGSSAVAGAGTYTVTLQDLGNSRRRITSQGSSTLLVTASNRSIEAIVQVSPSGGPPAGLFGDLSVNLNGSVRVDSYDSRIPGPVQSTNHGVVGSNGIAASTIRINGSVDVLGDVLAGPGAPSDAIQITGASHVSGRTGAAAQSSPMPPVNETIGTTDLRINGHQTVTLPEGTHRYRSITINGGGCLSFTGPAVVYIGNLDLNGNCVATSGNLPPNLTINVVGSGSVSLNGTSGFYGVIYAPQSAVSLNGNVQVYGAVSGRTISGNGSVNFWYDEALRTGGLGGGQNQVQPLSWRDLS